MASSISKRTFAFCIPYSMQFSSEVIPRASARASGPLPHYVFCNLSCGQVNMGTCGQTGSQQSLPIRSAYVYMFIWYLKIYFPGIINVAVYRAFNFTYIKTGNLMIIPNESIVEAPFYYFYINLTSQRFKIFLTEYNV